MHAYIHAFIMYTYIHTYIHTYIVHTYIPTRTPACFVRTTFAHLLLAHVLRIYPHKSD